MASAAGENFPVALRVLPSRYRRHLANLYCFARLTDDLGDEAAHAGSDDAAHAGTDEAAHAGTDTVTLRLRLLDEPAAAPRVRELIRDETERAEALLDAGAPLVGTLRGAARLAVAGYVAGGRAALAAIRRQRYDVLAGTPRPRKPRLAAALAAAYLRGR